MKAIDPVLTGLRVMIVEDQYTIAAEMRRLLEPLGVELVGPFAGVDQAMKATQSAIDVALLDINLQGFSVFPVADELTLQGVPYAFVTAYEANVLPPAYQNAARIEKPVDRTALLRMLAFLAGEQARKPA
jgi:CheY-like chemotaxis protein